MSRCWNDVFTSPAQSLLLVTLVTKGHVKLPTVLALSPASEWRDVHTWSWMSSTIPCPARTSWNVPECTQVGFPLGSPCKALLPGQGISSRGLGAGKDILPGTAWPTGPFFRSNRAISLPAALKYQLMSDALSVPSCSFPNGAQLSLPPPLGPWFEASRSLFHAYLSCLLHIHTHRGGEFLI